MVVSRARLQSAILQKYTLVEKCATKTVKITQACNKPRVPRESAQARPLSYTVIASNIVPFI